MSKTDKKETESKTEDRNVPHFDEEKQCPICIEIYTYSGSHKRIVCPYCRYAACRSCVETTLTDPDARKDPECFSCHKTWTRDFIHSAFTKTFQSGDLKRHREQVLYDRERSLLPATQTILETLEIRKKAERALSEEEHALRIEARRIKERLREIRYERIHLTRADVSEISMETVAHKTFIRPCPVSDCRGYLSTQWKCPLCETWVCKDCHVIKGAKNDADHKCKEEDVKTAELVMKETKPCPKCGTRIFKNGGCPQMWCTNCHTGFNWTSGKISTGPVHNPHYFEWLAKNGNNQDQKEPMGNENAGICGEIDIRKLRKRGGDQCSHINWYSIVRFINEVTDDLTHYPTENSNTYLYLRMSFLKGEIDELKFKRSLQMKEKKLSKLKEEREILQTFVDVSREELVRISNSSNKIGYTDVLEVYNRILQLKQYVNNQLIKLSSQYNNVCKAISEDLTWSDTNKLQGKKTKKKQKEQSEDEAEMIE